MKNCPICEKHADARISPLYQGKYWRVYYGPYESQVKGYLYLEPNRHVESWSEFTLDELHEMSELIRSVEMILKKLIPVDRLYIVTISETVRHLHLHLIPRLTDDEIKGIELISHATQQKAEQLVLDQQAYQQLANQLCSLFALM